MAISSGNKKCIRSYIPPVFGISTSTSISMSIALNSNSANSPLIFIQGDKNRFMALEMVNRRIRLLWNMGGTTTILNHPEEIILSDPKEDNAWYFIEANRTMNIGTLIVSKINNAYLLPSSATKKVEGDERHTFFHINPEGRYWLGGNPSNPNANMTEAPGLDVIIDKVTIDQRQIGLWHFDTSEGDCLGTLASLVSKPNTEETYFNGEGYAMVKKSESSLRNPRTFTIQLTFKTFDENALIFLAIDERNVSLRISL